MDLFLFFIGLLAFIICIVWLVVNLFKKKKFKKQGIGIVLSLILILFSLTMPKSKEEITVILQEKKVNYGQLLKKVESEEAKLLEIEEKIKEEKDKYKEEQEKVVEKEAETKEVMALVSSKDEITTEIESLNKDLDSKKDKITTEIESLNKDLDSKKVAITLEIESLNKKLDSKKEEAGSLDSRIKEKKAELDSIGTAIKEKGEAPIELSAGQFLVGHDFSSGRYKAIPVGRGGNFKVYDNDFNLIVNTILSTRDHGVSEYVFLVGEKYTINSNTPFKLIPIK